MYVCMYKHIYIYIYIFSDTWMARNAHIKHTVEFLYFDILFACVLFS